MINYKELNVWRESIELAVSVYRATARLPQSEAFALSSQMRRAAVSVSSNIAEGEGRRSARDHLRFLADARGSLYELETQIIICQHLGYLAADELLRKVETVARLLNGTVRHVKSLTS